MRVARCVVLLCICVALRRVALRCNAFRRFIVPAFLRSCVLRSSYWCLCARRRVCCVGSVGHSSHRGVVAYVASASASSPRTLLVSDQTTNETNPTYCACTHARTHTRPGECERPAVVPFFPLANAPLRIRQGGGPPNPILPAARARSVPKIENSSLPPFPFPLTSQSAICSLA